MLKYVATAALAATLTLPLHAAADEFDPAAMTDSEREAFRKEVRAYLLDNPEVIFEAIQILEQRRADETAEADRNIVAANADALFNDGYSYVGGNPDGDVTVVEFLDYRCGYCKRAHPEVEELLERDPNVRLVVKEFPILGPDSVVAGKMALAALEIDAENFAALHDALMTYDGQLTEAAAYQIAATHGYDVKALKELAGSQEIDDRLNKNYRVAQALGLQGTPAFIIGDQVVRGYLPIDEMLAAVERQRSASN